MKYINEFLRKKKPETFMDYAPGEVPKKTEKTSVGAIQESPAKTNTIKTYNTYTTSNRDLQNIHRNRTNAEQHTGRSLQDISNRSTSIVGDGILSSMTWFTDCLRTWFTLFVWDHCSKDKLCEKR